jgi:hypothetical protein
MEYLRPVPDEIHTRPNTLVITKTTDYSITDKTTGRSTITRIKIAEMNTGLDKDGYMYGKAIGEIPMEYIEAIYRYQEFQMQLAHYGELVYQRLLSFLISYYPSQTKGMLKKGFMTLRDKLSETINKDERLHSISEFNTPESRKSFGKLFAEFIEDRNIYEHGSLVYRTNDNKVLMHYIDRKDEKYSYKEINLNIMESYKEVFHYLNKTLEKLSNRLGELNKRK